MILLRLSEVGTDQQVLVNPDHIVRIRVLRSADALRLVLSLVDGKQLDCFPLGDTGGFDSTTDDENAVLRNFQLAINYMQNQPTAEQGSSYPGDR